MKKSIALLALLFSTTALATEDMPNRFIVGKAPAEVTKGIQTGKEKPSAILGSTYTIVPFTFTDLNGNQSFLRFANGDATTATITVAVVGNPSQQVYGTAIVTVPPLASPQYSIFQITQAAGVPGYILPYGDTGVSLYLRDNRNYGVFQHVVYNPVSRFFENASVCTYEDNHSYGALSQALINVHTTRVVGYPVAMGIHNYYSGTVTYAFDVYEASTGTFKGSVSYNLAANTSYAFDMSFLQSAIGWSPAPNEVHANIIVRSLSTSGYYALLGQLIVNSDLNAFVNMTQICPISH